MRDLQSIVELNSTVAAAYDRGFDGVTRPDLSDDPYVRRHQKDAYKRGRRERLSLLFPGLRLSDPVSADQTQPPGTP